MGMSDNNLSIEVIGMVWYREADYDKLIAMFVDGRRLHKTFLQWQDAAEQGRKRMVRQGKPVIKCYIDPVTFPAWCANTGHELDAKGRNAFASLEAGRVAREMQANSGSRA